MPLTHSLCGVLLLLQLVQCQVDEKDQVNNTSRLGIPFNDTEDGADNFNELDEINFSVIEHVMNQASKPIWFNLENPVNPFIGREAELSELRLGQVNNKITIITGPRGVGKTELVRKYAQEMKHDNTSSILWMDATTHESLINSFKDLVVHIGKTLESKSMTSILRETFEFFRNRPCIFILDHAASDNIIIKNLNSFIGRSRKQIHVIITSRNEEWEEDYKIIKLAPFTKDNSLEYLKVILRKEIDMTVVDSVGEKLSDLLKHLPLALNKATSYIIQKNTILIERIYTIEDYIEDLLKLDAMVEPTSTVPPGPSDEEIEERLLDKIKQEGDRIVGHISTGATDAWEKISSESASFGTKVADEAKRTGQTISDETARIEKQFRDLFKFG